MKEKWIMTLRNVQYEDDDTTEITLNTEANYLLLSDGTKAIVYQETETTGMEGSITRLQVSSDNTVSIIRNGTFQAHLVIQMGKKHFCSYETPFGELSFGVSAKYVHNNLTSDNGGTLAFRYIIDSNSSLLSDNEILIEIKKHVC